ncbi:unnamed protein product [Heterobilharzia americana]|nr:unnamed protein product [Heterobilharzia americana]
MFKAKTEVDDFEQRKVSNLIEPHGSSKRKHYGRSRELPQNNCMMTVEVSENSKKTKTVSKPQITSSEFRLDFLNIPTLLNGKKHFNQYLMQTTDEDSETYKSKRTTFKTNLLKFNINLKEKLNNQLFDETVMKAELKNALFQWATECGVEISKVPSRKIKYIFHCSNTLDIKVQLQAIVSIGIFETKLESEEIENLRGYLLHRNAEIVLSTCLCLTIMDYSDKKCIEKLCELLVLNQSPSKMNEENTRISFTLSYTSVNLLKWASSICLAKLNQCNLEILNNLTNPLFDQLIQFIPQQYPNKHFNKELNESSGSVGSLSHIIDRRTKSFVSNLSNLIAFDLKKANNFLTRIVCHSEIKMVLRLSRDHPQVEYYLTELLTSPNWRIRLCSCWLLSILLCNLCKNTLTRINRLLLLDWSSMLRIAALHSLHAEIKTMNPSLLWANQLFNDPFLLNNVSNKTVGERIHVSSLTSKSIPQRRADRLYQLCSEGLPRDKLIELLHNALMDEFSCVREMACIIIKELQAAEEPVILNELLKILESDVNDKVKLTALQALKTIPTYTENITTAECIQNQLCHIVQFEMNTHIRQELFRLLLWFVKTRFITCDTTNHLNYKEIDLLAKRSILEEYNSLKQKSIDFNSLFDIQNEVIKHILKYDDEGFCVSQKYSDVIREIFIPNYNKSTNYGKNQFIPQKLHCNLYYLYNSLKKCAKYDDCEEIRSELSQMIEPIFTQILKQENENAPENCFYSYYDDTDLLRALMDEKCKDLVKICFDIIQYS